MHHLLTGPDQGGSRHLTTKRLRVSAVSFLLGVASLLATTAPAGAIIDGQPDTSNAYPNVGRIEYQLPDGSWSPGCSGTLVATDVVLTAAHCVTLPGEEVIPAAIVRVNFNPQPNWFPADPADPLAYGVSSIAVHPAFQDATPGPASSKISLAPGWEDVALLRLAQAVADITPSPVAGAGYLDALDLHSQTFTAVGYGLNGFVAGSIVSGGLALIPEYRSFRTVSALGMDAYPDRWLKISAATCFIDSGGPILYEGTLVAVVSWTNSMRCEGPGLAYRLDSAVAQEFLADNL